MGSPYVVLTDGSEFSFTGVQCLFADSHRDELANLSKGNIVTLRGRGDGYLMNAIVRVVVSTGRFFTGLLTGH